MDRRPIKHIRARCITTSVALMLVAQAVACGTGAIDLGARGGAFAQAGTSASMSGGTTGAAAAAGSVDKAASGHAGSTATGSAPAMGGAGMLATSGQASPLAGDGAQAGSGGSSDAVPLSSSGCGMDPPAVDNAIMVDAMRASYLVDLATGYDKRRPYPLVMAFHGAGVTGDAFRGYLNLPPVTGADAILVHPNCSNDAPTWDMQRDTQVFDALLTKLESEYCIDLRRIFIAGHGSGAFFVSSLGCVRGDQLRGIASLSGGPPSGTCVGELAVWVTQGNADMSVQSGRSNRSFWAKHNRCDDVSMSSPVDPAPCVEYLGCDPGFPVRYCEYDGNLDLPSFAASGLWAFFKQL